MPAITVRGVTLLPRGTLPPTNFKILVPVMANNLSNAAAAGAAGDVVKLRLDALSILDAPNVQNVLCARPCRHWAGRSPTGHHPNQKRGSSGQGESHHAVAYGELGTAICHSGLADLLDVEASTAPAVMAAIQQQARESGVKTVFSSHNFAETPPTETMVNTLTDMVRRRADIAKLAVMPHTPADTACWKPPPRQPKPQGTIPRSSPCPWASRGWSAASAAQRLAAVQALPRRVFPAHRASPPPPPCARRWTPWVPCWVESS